MKDNSVYEPICLNFPENNEKSTKALNFIKAFGNKRRMLIEDLVLNCMQKYGITDPEQIDKNTKNYILNEVRYNNSSNEVNSGALLKLFTQLVTTASVAQNAGNSDGNIKGDSVETIKEEKAVASSEHKDKKLPDEPEVIEEIMQEDNDIDDDDDSTDNERQNTLDALRMFGCI